MTKLLLIPVMVGLWSGCVFQDPTGPTEGPEGRRYRTITAKMARAIGSCTSFTEAALTR
jgi:hypothetical protein